MENEDVQQLYLGIYLEGLEKVFKALKNSHKELTPKYRKVMKEILIHFQQECFNVLEGEEAQFPLNSSGE